MAAYGPSDGGDRPLDIMTSRLEPALALAFEVLKEFADLYGRHALTDTG